MAKPILSDGKRWWAVEFVGAPDFFADPQKWEPPDELECLYYLEPDNKVALRSSAFKEARVIASDRCGLKLGDQVVVQEPLPHLPETNNANGAMVVMGIRRVNTGVVVGNVPPNSYALGRRA